MILVSLFLTSNIFSAFPSSLVSVSIVDFEHVFVYWEQAQLNTLFFSKFILQLLSIGSLGTFNRYVNALFDKILQSILLRDLEV